MSQTGQDMSSAWVLDELGYLATVEHALVVEYVSVRCALGHDLQPAEGGPATTATQSAATTADILSQRAMTRLRTVVVGLFHAGRTPLVGRADSITSTSGAVIALGPPSLADLQRLVEREDEIAAAVDERYAQLRPAVTTDPVFEGALLSELRSVVEDGTKHAAGVAGLHNALYGLAPDEYLHATRRETDDDFEQGLLNASDRVYHLVPPIVEGWLGQEDSFSFGPISRSLAVEAMFALDEANRLLVRRGMLPPFTP
jgi:hypothetical protein